MKSDEQIMQELERATDGLMWMSESDYPFEVVLFEDAVETTPALLRHLAAQPLCAPVAVESLDDFFRPAVTNYPGQDEAARQAAEKYRRLVQSIKTNLQDSAVYRVGEINIQVYIVGKAPSGRLLGISTRVVET